MADLSSLAGEVTEAVLNAVQRQESIQELLRTEKFRLVVHPEITAGGRIEISRGLLAELPEVQGRQG
jgi:hypothetical protein